MFLFKKLSYDTQEHSRRVAELSVKLAVLSGMSTEEQAKIGVAAMYHDIGKIMVDERILNKADTLTAEEYLCIKQHVSHGCTLMAGYFSEEICQMILYHHENINGSGYLKQTEIPSGARIIRICDVYDAMTSCRPYHNARTREETLAYIKKNAGILFDQEFSNIFPIVSP